MQEVFSRGMTRWFAIKGFQVGIPTDNIDQSSGVDDFQSRLKSFGKLSATIGAALKSLPQAERLGRWALKVGTSTSVGGKFGKLAGAAGKAGKVGAIVGTAALLSEFLIDTKTTAVDLYEALKPYMWGADLLGLKVSNFRLQSTFKENPENKTFWNTVLVLVIYADELTPALIQQRFDKFLRASGSLKRLGLRAKFVGNRAHIYPLLVYFDSKKLEDDRESLWPQIFEESEEGVTEGGKPQTLSKRTPWTPEFKAHLSAGVISVPERQVISEIFDEDDLYSVLEWGQNNNSSK